MQKTIFALIAVFAMAAIASAQGFEKAHPLRAQVNNRANRAAANGKISKRQAAKDKHEERAMARKDGGHITKADQAKLNHRISHQEARDAGH